MFLRILGKRADGFHQLASLFQAIDLGDHLTFRSSTEDALTCTDPTIPTDGRNLIFKALELFRQKTSIYAPISIHIEKHIPAQAGLGGGSSNAATTLWALNTLHGSKYTPEELASWAAEIGSDISFFFSLGTAYCTGRGEILRPLPELPHLGSFCVCKPNVGLSTQRIYQALDLSTCSKHDPEVILETFLRGTPHFVNDLEAPAFAALPELIAYKQQLRAGTHTALMTGSGTAFFTTKKEMGTPTSFIRRSPSSWY